MLTAKQISNRKAKLPIWEQEMRSLRDKIDALRSKPGATKAEYRALKRQYKKCLDKYVNAKVELETQEAFY